MTEPTFCATHPMVETYLRCNRCNKPICPKCAIRMDVGYRCRECMGMREKVFFAGFKPVYYFIAAAVALPASVVAGWLLPSLGWFAIFLGPLAGAGIAELARWAIKRRRGQHTWLVVCGCIIVGWLIGLAISLVSSVLQYGSGSAWLPGWLVYRVWDIIYIALAVGGAYGRLRPGRRI